MAIVPSVDAKALLAAAGHRPWPLPPGRWLLAQRWEDLAFVHYEVDPNALARRLPDGLELDTWEGRAFVGVVPFEITFDRMFGRVAPPGADRFCELNVRTYVRVGDAAGVYFFSLDAASRVAVWGGRTYYRLPYVHADMEIRRDGENVAYRCVRRGAPEVAFEGRYGPTGPVAPADPGSLEAFLTERYCLFTTDRRGRVYRCDIHHAPWPLAPGRAEIERDTMLAPVGIEPQGPPTCVHVSRSIDVLIWPLRGVR